jgi:long-chain acyl-CoA synthetase
MAAQGEQAIGYAERPWLRLYDEGKPAEIEVEHDSALAMFRAGLEAAPEAELVRYFDVVLSAERIDELSDALACALLERGIEPGDRVAVYLQNVPQFVISMLATWKAGAIMVSVNPMLKHDELRVILRDSGAKALVALESLWANVAAKVVPETSVEIPITTSELDFFENPPALLADGRRQRADGVPDLLELVDEHRGKQPPAVTLAPDDVALLTYTSGTTGPPKGAMNTHRNVVFNSQTYRDWIELDRGDVILGMAPLFHVTGLIGHIGVSLLLPAQLVLGYRFEAATMVDLIARYGATFAIGPITAFIALMNEPSATPERLAKMTKVYSGGAPIAPAVADAYEERFSASVHAAYGLTETTSPSHFTPLRGRSPVDPRSGAFSVGVPVFNFDVRVVDEEGEEVPVGEIGELMMRGPAVVPGYWQQPEETAHAFPDGELRTGDVGFMDSDGWFFIVDRRKDQINAAGYKIWPREVEDVLYEHPAVREAAVVGVPDPYRGETVKAFVSLKQGAEPSEEELIAFCKERMAAYKYPRIVEIIEEVPKTASGKVLRRELREGSPAEDAKTVASTSGAEVGPREDLS